MLSQGWTYPYIKVAAAGQPVTHMRSQQQTTTIQSIPNNNNKKTSANTLFLVQEVVLLEYLSQQRRKYYGNFCIMPTLAPIELFESLDINIQLL